MMVEISKATDNEVGDGTTSVVVLAGALSKRLKILSTKVSTLRSLLTATGRLRRRLSKC